MNIINITIVIIINSVVGNFTGIGPDNIFQIFVFKINTGINNSNFALNVRQLQLGVRLQF